MDSRRGFLRRTLGAAWLGAGLLEQAVLRGPMAMAQSKASSGLPDLFDIEKVADGVYAALARPTALINCNAAIFEIDQDLLIVDTHSKPSAVVTLVSQVRRSLTTKPVRFIVNSHFHWDHTQGSPTYKRIAPRADIIASEATRKLLSENGAARLKASVEEAVKAIDGYKSKASASSTAEEKAYWRRMAAESREYVSEMKDYVPELPNITFDRELILHFKTHDLHLAFRGRGHTGGDVVVYCPQKKVIATGDLLHGFAPYIADGYPREWPRTLEQVAEFPFEHVIGGHGGVQSTRARLFQMAHYIEELTGLVHEGKQKGKPVEEIVRETTPQNLRTLADGAYGDFLCGNLLKYRPQPPGMTLSSLLSDAVGANIRDIYSALERS